MFKIYHMISGALDVAVVTAGAAQATFYEYAITGMSTGALGGAAFTNAAFKITIISDAAKYKRSAEWEEYNSVESLVFDIAGFALARLTIGATLGRNYNTVAGNSACIYARSPNCGVILRMDNDPAFEMPSEFFLTLNSRLAAFTDAPTGEWLLSFTEVSSATFSAVAVSDVPPPAPAALLLVGLGGFAPLRRRAA